ncbi:glycosyltransferase [Guptibacillus algicola]|uniref:glycosyltransferase n=1 Tax=Guptibacillus algicola TaxID=225844 RepID=UPI001CD3E878|nr:glycosyltransferase family 2 protein [Alkalihalobacillus algicola]MCA0988252.1 glycosyltransferase [Alkalihalobacillus algicola]
MLLMYIIILAAFLGWTMINSYFMPALPKGKSYRDKDELVSILIPLRNEEDNVPDLITNLRKLTYPNVEFILLDDDSSDRTLTLLTELTKGDERFSILEGNDLPPTWNGKVYACHQLSERAKGDYLLFIDADIRLHRDTIQSTLTLIKKMKASMLSGFPAFPVSLWLEKLLVPLQHFVVHFHLPLLPANWTTRPAFTAAHGAFILVKHREYKMIDGHKAIHNSLVDDVDLSRAFKAHGYRSLLANVTTYTTCYMYRSNKDVWEGFTKNLFPGLGRSLLLVIFLFLFYGVFYVLPFILLLLGLMSYIQGMPMFTLFFPYLLITLQKAWVDWITNQSIRLSLFMPLSALAFMLLLINSTMRGLKQKGYVWKGRTYS